ncbi:Glyceraldehyde dehydrogenase small chain (modular protein) [Tenacibaculum sediminilitoris]|uniref:2Fe-2S iron-sulfur cluster-binding protein n=1 Tax=Tenacibaculum sediminilitoris TaxID=1820334 RepID=UPI003896729D
MIQFILNNQVIKTTANAGITLLDFIREHQQLKGTKIGCREGDCGACTVLIGEQKNGSLSYQSITSCISPLGNANGKHIVTIEGINLPKELNTVQKAMTDNYAMHCGFCTPGFVVSMTGYALDSKQTTSCKDAVSGNICRCTGYKSIEKAGFEIEQRLQQKDNNHQIDWLIKEGFIPNYFETIPEKLAQIQPKTFDKVIANHEFAAKQNNALLFPVGKIWKQYNEHESNTSFLYSSDNFHPSTAGSFLAALTIFHQLHPTKNIQQLPFKKYQKWVADKGSFDFLTQLIQKQ